MIKDRFDVIASSLGSYFGVGFNTPLQQMSYDLGLEENTFDEASQDRMNLGIFLEDAALNYFENKFNIKITNRNDTILWAFDNKLKCKIDGETVFNGEPTVVENKISNSQSGKFTEDRGYYLQCQAYMAATGYKQALLLGLWNGKPIHRVIQRDEEVIEMIRQVVEFLFDCFNGLADPKDFPYHITAMYVPPVIVDDVQFDEVDKDLVQELYELKQLAKKDTDRIEELEKYFKSKFKNIKYEGPEYTVSITTYTRPGSIDLDLIKEDFPLLDETKYKKADSEYNTLRISPKKKPK